MNGPLWMAVLFLITMAIGVPIPFAAGVATLVGLWIIDIPMTLLAQSAYNAFEPFPLTTIPLFTLAGQLMEKGGMSDHLIEISRKLVGAYKGGLGLVTVVGCMFFAALSGSGPATTAAIGSITIPAMLDENYKPRFAGAVAAAAGALGSMIPPSNLLIIYGLVTDVSIPRLFLAGIVPGLLIGLLLLAVAFLIAKKNNYGLEGEKFSFRPLLKAIWDGKWALGAPVIILGGIYSGIFTASEAAAVAVFYGLFVGLFVYRKLNARNHIRILPIHGHRYRNGIVHPQFGQGLRPVGYLVRYPRVNGIAVRPLYGSPLVGAGIDRFFLHHHRHVDRIHSSDHHFYRRVPAVGGIHRGGPGIVRCSDGHDL